MTIGDHIDAIYARHGKLTPDLVVATARPKNHPLHPHVFDLAPKDAAEAWYRHRAHELIVSVTVVYREADGAEPARKVRRFHAVRTEAGHVYEPAERVAEDPFMRKLVLQSMEREWKQLYSRYETFAEFLAMVAADITSAEAV